MDVKEQGTLTVKRKVVAQFEENNVTFRELDGINQCDHAPILQAFPHVGVTGILATQYIIDQLDLPLVGVVTHKDGMPSSVVMKSQPGPSIRVYGNEKIVVWISETKLSDQTAQAVVRHIISFAQRHNSGTIYCAEGVPSQEQNVKRKKQSFLTTHQETGDKLTSLGHQYLHEAVINGVTGGIVSEAPLIEPHVTCLLCPSSAFFPDASSALELVKLLIALIPALQNINTAPLEDKASFLEDKVKKLLKLTNSGGGPPPGMFG